MNRKSIDSTIGARYHYEHVNKIFANKLDRQSKELHVVEAINWTYANGDKNRVHHKWRWLGIFLLT